ncbi:kinase [Thraustotheca clavata]|uniref:Kinase n=1 Tax=Thraustotheca clavata TaxID=74557 RepID=A0A1W0A4B5_9STRA|nr:kinase [Thraustotheca clavata]
MGCGSSIMQEPVGISVDTHKFVHANKAGTLANSARVRIKKKGDEIVTESRNLGEVFFGLNVPFKEIDVKSTLGAGNFGVVYEAYVKGKRVAVKKIYLREDGDKSSDLDDFEQEVDILSLLVHPNIVHFLGSVQEYPNYCLITELCEGSVLDLLKLVESKKVRTTWSLVLDIATDCANACAYLHSLEPIILHRDIKAENLLITELFRCKLSDFGLSRSLEKDAIANTVCGTPRWVAPEVYRGEVYSEKIDVYSYGIVLWELFCFKKPYLDQDPINLPYMVVHKNLRPPLCVHIPEVLHTLMKSCWHADPAERPSFPTILQLLSNARNDINTNITIDTNISYDETVENHARKQSQGIRMGIGLKSGLI